METLDGRVQFFAILGSALLFVFVLELLRRRRLAEPYAILWLGASVVLLILSIWDDLLNSLADAVGIRTPANALFVVGFGFVLILLLSFSSVISRLTRENKLLAQEIARLNEERGKGSAPAPRPTQARASGRNRPFRSSGRRPPARRESPGMESASRTLVKSPPELWELIDQPERMQGLMSSLVGHATEINVYKRTPEERLCWEAREGDGKIEVELAESGWGTQVDLSAESGGGGKQLEGWLDAVMEELATPSKRPFGGVV